MLLCFSLSACNGQPAMQTSKTMAAPTSTSGKNIAVVELFTSEGCSSCPSADKLLPQLQKEYGDKLVTLSFHVDYWNRLGWKDPFSSAENTQRQYQYANALGTESVYTPQAVVNGNAHITGSNRSGLKTLIDNALKRSENEAVNVTAKASGSHKVDVSFEATLKENEVLHIALVQRETAMDVRRGENSGRRLEHHNVVRDFKTTADAKGSITLSIPDGLSPAECAVIAYVQTKGMKINGAGMAEIL